MVTMLHNAIGVLALATVVLPQAPGTLSPAQERRALTSFHAAVHRYLEVRRVHEPMPLDAMTSDREAIERWRATLAAGIRFARVPANEGDVFGPDVEALVRTRLRDMAGVHIAMPLDMDEGDGRRTPAVSINDSLPWGVAVRVPPDLLVALPPIPESLEYRLLGNDLLLWDARVDLVVDILREVVRAP